MRYSQIQDYCFQKLPIILGYTLAIQDIFACCFQIQESIQQNICTSKRTSKRTSQRISKRSSKRSSKRTSKRSSIQGSSGIQNATGTEGIQVSSGSGFADNNKSLLFSTGLNWLDMNGETTGQLTFGASMIHYFDVNAGELFNGEYISKWLFAKFINLNFMREF